LSRKKSELNEVSIRDLRVGSFHVELLPRRSYQASYRPDKAVIGFAFESQDGFHAFSSDRVKPFRTKPNSLAFVPSGCEVFSSSTKGGEYLLVNTENNSTINSFTSRQFNDVIDPVAIAAAQTIRSALLGNISASLLIEETVIALFERVQLELKGSLSEVIAGRWMTSARLKSIDEIIDSNISQELSIRDMAAALGLSEGFFIRAFKAAIGKSPHSYLIDRRLAQARALLRTSNHDLREIALATGFSSHAHMTAAFTHRLGIAPNRLRQEINGDGNADPAQPRQ
jgi:AraC family transcriptional regulator